MILILDEDFPRVQLLSYARQMSIQFREGKCRQYLHRTHKHCIHARYHPREPGKLQTLVQEMPKQISKINTDYEVLLAEYNGLRLEQEAGGESITTLMNTINDLVEHNKELKKENNWYKQELARGHRG